MPTRPDDTGRIVRDLEACLGSFRESAGADMAADPRGSWVRSERPASDAGDSRVDATGNAPGFARSAPVAPSAPSRAEVRKTGAVTQAAAPSTSAVPTHLDSPPPSQTSLLGAAEAPVAASPGLRRSRGAEPGQIEAGTGEPIVRGRCKPGHRAELLEAIDVEVRACRKCRLCEARTKTVFGVGDPCARLCFVGEGPGADEDRQGEPFVGRAGQLLNKIIAAMGLKRSEVYIANTVKCRPPENRTPLPEEMQSCSPYLVRQLEAITPQVIVALGRPAVQDLLGTTQSMSDVRGRFHRYRGIPVVPTYHPAYLLRNPSAKKQTWDDMRLVMKFLEETPDPLKGPET